VEERGGEAQIVVVGQHRVLARAALDLEMVEKPLDRLV
jgi:hypothetical protein